MGMPVDKWPSLRTVLRRVFDAGWAFVRRAGTLILATMILVWAVMYFPRTDAEGKRLDLAADELRARIDAIDEDGPDAGKRDLLEEEYNAVYGRWKQQSFLGQAGKAIEPAVRPLGWDWRVGIAALASFPAREVVVGTLGIIYNQGKVEADSIRKADDAGETKLGQALRDATWDDEPQRKVFTLPTALSLMVFFALCCQCASTLAVIRRETRSWWWPAFTFTYMTALAYVGALLTYQAGTWLGA